MAESQAKVAQELAIAQRINTAEEVEIEEFYDVSGKGNIGLQVDMKSETLGLGAGVKEERLQKESIDSKAGITGHLRFLNN